MKYVTDTAQKIQRWQISTWEDVSHPYFLGKCKKIKMKFHYTCIRIIQKINERKSSIISSSREDAEQL